MRANSLALRLFLSATVWTVLILLITGFVLSGFYRDSVERAFDRRLGVYLKTLIADLASPDIPVEKTGQMLGEPLFELPLSGWYWQVTRVDRTKPEVTSSRSLWDRGLPHLSDLSVAPDPDGSRKSYVQGPEDQRLRLIERDVDLGDDGRFLVAVGGDAAELDDEVLTFDGAIVMTFLVLAAVLLLTTLFQVRFGLAPLNRISRSLAAIRSGKAEKLVGSFPVEIEPLARETNALIDANREIVERARTHVGNLAHALKTPLSVITNEAREQKGPLADKVVEQAEIMRTQITHHLDRARVAARSNAIGDVTEVKPVLDALKRTLDRIYEERGLALKVICADELKFRGEKQDFEEMVGNLLDNACKWAKGNVSVSAERAKDADMIDILVDDDGPGLTEADRAKVVKRGQRLDETKPGSGLGLSIVADLADLYKGRFGLAPSPQGGLRAKLELPAA